MNDLPQKSSEELAAELLELMPRLRSLGYGWRALFWTDGHPTAQVLYPIAQLVLAQQQEIEQLKAELEELKQR